MQRSNASIQAQGNKATRFLKKTPTGNSTASQRYLDSNKVTRPQRKLTTGDKIGLFSSMFPNTAETIGAASTGFTYHKYMKEGFQHMNWRTEQLKTYGANNRLQKFRRRWHN